MGLRQRLHLQHRLGLQLKSEPKVFMGKPNTNTNIGKPKTYLHHKNGPSAPTQTKPELHLLHSSSLLQATVTEELEMRGFVGGPRSWSKLSALRAAPPRRAAPSAVEHVQL